MGDIVYHYTDANGVIGIVKDKHIWASDSQYLNDSQELHYASTQAREHLHHLSDGPDSFRAGQWLTQLDTHYPNNGDINTVREDTPLVASFCKNGDLLSMWRGYGSDGGYAIGFDRDILDRLFTQHDQGEQFPEPEWTDQTNFGLRGAAVDVSYGWDNAMTASLLEQSPAMGITDQLIRIKHPAHEEEQEVRLVVYTVSCMVGGIELRPGRTNLVPFLPIQFPHEAIRSVTVGPGRYQERNRDALEEWLHLAASGRGDWSHVQVLISTVPYIA